jgi:hypothetical protein
MTCYIPPPYRPSRVRSAISLCVGILAMSAMFGAIAMIMFIISAMLEN